MSGRPDREDAGSDASPHPRQVPPAAFHELIHAPVRRLTRGSLTPVGRSALAAHLAALRAIADGDPVLEG